MSNLNLSIFCFKSNNSLVLFSNDCLFLLTSSKITPEKAEKSAHRILQQIKSCIQISVGLGPSVIRPFQQKVAGIDIFDQTTFSNVKGHLFTLDQTFAGQIFSCLQRICCESIGTRGAKYKDCKYYESLVHCWLKNWNFYKDNWILFPNFIT